MFFFFFFFGETEKKKKKAEETGERDGDGKVKEWLLSKGERDGKWLLSPTCRIRTNDLRISMSTTVLRSTN